MSPLTRRAFLQVLAAGVGSAAAGRLMAACNLAAREAGVPAGSVPSTIALPTSQAFEPQPPTPTPRPTSVSWPDLAVARGGDDPGLLVERALAALGGMERFVPRGPAS